MKHSESEPIRPTRRRFLFAAVVIVLFTAAAAPIARSQDRATLRKVEILGLQRLSADQVLAVTGLKVGDTVDRSMLDGAANKLMRTGWFKSVDYRVQTSDNDTNIVFEVVEKAPVNNDVPAGDAQKQTVDVIITFK